MILIVGCFECGLKLSFLQEDKFEEVDCQIILRARITNPRYLELRLTSIQDTYILNHVLSSALDSAGGHLSAENSATRAKRTGEANQKLSERSEFF